MPRIKDIPGPYHIYFVSFDCADGSKLWIPQQRTA